MKTLITVCLLIVISGCSAKNNQTVQTPMPDEEIKQSILNASELEFATSFGEAFDFTEPEKLLELTNEKLVKAQAEQAETTALLVLRALVQSQLGLKNEAFDDLTMAVQARPHAEIYALRAFVLWRGGKLRGAKRDADYALLKQDNLALATMVQGLVFYSEKNMDNACQYLENACKNNQCYGLQLVQDEGACK